MRIFFFAVFTNNFRIVEFIFNEEFSWRMSLIVGININLSQSIMNTRFLVSFLSSLFQPRL